jgi:2-methylcitrate dehydratase PrpD
MTADELSTATGNLAGELLVAPADVDAAVVAFTLRTTYADLPGQVVRAAKAATIDTIAAMLAGARSELVDPLLGYLTSVDATGDRPVVGTPVRTSPDKAALVNATLGHALDLDDTVSAMPGHPSSVVLAALFACPAVDPSTGSALLASYVVGVEVATKIGMALGGRHYRRGWHTTGTAGIFGATAAVGNLLRLSPDAMHSAFGIASSMAAGLRANFGTMAKPMHSGWAASAGQTAALLAANGFTGSPSAFGGDRGFLNVYGDLDTQPEFLLRLGTPFTFEQPGVALKRYPCCYAGHRAIDALRQLRAEHRLDASTVRRITAVVPPHSLDPLPYPRPTTGLEAKFSMEYVLAVGILDGDYGLDAFSDAAVRRSAITELLERTEAREDPVMSPDDPEGNGASAGSRGAIEVRVQFTDGSTASRRVIHPPGSPANPLGPDDLRSKLLSCASFGGFPTDRAEAVMRILQQLDEQPSVSPLLALLAGEA